ncbi:MAG: aspartate carbamoyltransferase regulatory subunit [Verrucomicrobiota bacterium]|nr:aspartate carbamoyltransferase regulatory subunit [Verrucomicrobiota bacterium]
MKEKTLSVSAIKDGTVIDHIAAGQGLKIVRILNLGEVRITIGLNLKSASVGLKDLVKIEGVFLTPQDAAHITLFSPSATVNVIENYKVVKKFTTPLPESVSGILYCSHSQCITHFETVPSLFAVEKSNGLILLRCRYCEKTFHRDEVKETV